MYYSSGAVPVQELPPFLLLLVGVALLMLLVLQCTTSHPTTATEGMLTQPTILGAK